MCMHRGLDILEVMTHTGLSNMTVADVAEQLGIPVPTVRAWERRYGWPSPERTYGGHRRYSSLEVDRLLALRNEIARGRSAATAVEMLEGIYAERLHEAVQPLVDAAQAMDQLAARDVLEDLSGRIEPEVAVAGVAMPALREIGDSWDIGRCDVAGEHLVTDEIRNWLRRLTELWPPEPGAPIVALACGPEDAHSGGLEAFALLLASRACHPVILGPRTPGSSLVGFVVAKGAKAAVVVSHLAKNRKEAMSAMRRVVKETGVPLYYSGNAFSPARSRRGAPGEYLGWDLIKAADRVAGELVGRGRTGRRRAETI